MGDWVYQNALDEKSYAGELGIKRKTLNTFIHQPAKEYRPQSSNRSPEKGMFFQPKLSINQPNDIYEQQADAVADQVMRQDFSSRKDAFFKPSNSQNTVQRKCLECEEEGKKVQRKPLMEETQVQRKCKSCEEDEKNIQRKPLSEGIIPIVQAKGEGGINVTENLSERISASRGNGSKMDDSTKEFMSRSFGADFSKVKIHTGSEAVQMNKEINAKAFTTGNDIYFNADQYQPGTKEGKQLLAHELTHVIQQKGPSSFIQRAEIDHGTISWSDFMGTPPKGNAFDAETFSDIRYPDLTTIKPVIATTATTEDCTRKEGDKDVPEKKNEAKIKMDSSGIKVTSFFSQEKSWVKPLFKDPAEMAKFCTNDKFTKGEITNCKATIKSTTASRDTQCAAVNDGCTKAVAESQTFKIEIGGETLEATNTAECETILGKCNTTLGKSIEYKTGKGTSITTDADCTTVITNECLKDRQDIADGLLSHEQGHFDITDVIAKKLETDIKAIVDGYAEKTVTGCGADEANKNANDIVTKEVNPKIADKVKEAQQKVDEVKGYTNAKKVKVKGTLSATQDKYDSETTHGTKATEQGQWKTNIGTGNI